MHKYKNLEHLEFQLYNISYVTIYIHTYMAYVYIIYMHDKSDSRRLSEE